MVAAMRWFQSACHAAAHTNHSAGTVKSSTHLSMSSTFRMIQLNVRKQGAVHDSLMNDERLQDFAVLVIQEPYVRKIDGKVMTVPMGHPRWTKMIPTAWREGRWGVRSMLWVNRDLEAEQVPTPSPDMTAVAIRLPDRMVLVVSVYVPPQEPETLRSTCRMLRR
jgi:hypothetical protein